MSKETTLPTVRKALIEKRSYKIIYLSPYFPKLKLFENFWSVVKRNQFEDTEDLGTKITDAGKGFNRETLCNITSHSIRNF
ncbi:hypothetical protein BY458DRAFT_439232 [Sporodiniella umbellata]|nr:hypothetical protein BY458DRAFT_439232 [Sporodiniella umbellata]